MGRCLNHPDVETSCHCMKQDVYLCEACLACRDPKFHCRLRASCLFWFLVKRGGRDVDRINEESGTA